MAKLPITAPDPTLVAADAAMVAGQDRYKRKYLGMSAIGDPCERKLWYSFRHAKTSSFDAVTLKRFEDGHRTEDLLIARLRKIDGLEIHDRDHNNPSRQIGVSDFGGHFSGHLDFVVQGLIQAPKTWHVGEVKCSEKWTDIAKFKASVGEKNTLLKFSETYYGQAQCYMHYLGLERHWTVVASPGGRQWDACRTDYDPAHAMRLRAKAERVIFGSDAPSRIGGPTDYRCRFCDFRAICHEQELPERACRGCIHATALREGGWKCEAGHAFGTVCGDHRYVPSMLNGEQMDVRGGNVVYRFRKDDGGEYVDRGI